MKKSVLRLMGEEGKYLACSKRNSFFNAGNIMAIRDIYLMGKMSSLEWCGSENMILSLPLRRADTAYTYDENDYMNILSRIKSCQGR